MGFCYSTRAFRKNRVACWATPLVLFMLFIQHYLAEFQVLFLVIKPYITIGANSDEWAKVWKITNRWWSNIEEAECGCFVSLFCWVASTDTQLTWITAVEWRWRFEESCKRVQWNMILILSLVLFQEFCMGKNAEPSDIANSCSYEPTADEKKFSISKGTYKN